MLGDTGVWHHCVKVSFCQFLLFLWFWFVSLLVLLVSSCFSSLHRFSMCCSLFRVVSVLVWVLQLPQSVLLSWSNFFQDYFFNHIPSNVPYHVSFSQYLSFYISCISPVHSHVSFCGSFCVSSCVSCPCWLSPFPKYIQVKVTCSFDWLRIWWFDCYFHPVWWWLELTVTGTELFMASSHTHYPCRPLLLKQNGVLSDCSASIISLLNLTHYAYNLLHKVYCIWLRII